MQSSRWLLSLAGFPMILLLLQSCSQQAPSDAHRNESSGAIVASTWPMTTLARELLGAEIPVECLIESGEDPVHWTPDADALSKLIGARAVLINGADLEGWLLSANVAPTRLIRLSDSFRDRWIQYEGDLQHSHGSQGAHNHAGMDPHVWMDPLLALEQARALQTQAVDRGWLTPPVAAERAAALEMRLRELDGLWARVAEALQGNSLLANHDAYSYPALRHGLKITVVDADPDQELTDVLAAELTLVAGIHKPRAMLFESEPHASVTNYLRNKLSLEPMVLSPAESPGELDSIESMGRDLKQLLQHLTAGSGQ